jgi:hypothetical protein
MVKEARALFPLYPFSKTDYTPIGRKQSWIQVVRSVYDILFSALRSYRVNRGRKEVAIQLTLVFCAPSQFFPSGSNVTAESIRKAIERRARSRTKPAA